MEEDEKTKVLVELNQRSKVSALLYTTISHTNKLMGFESSRELSLVKTKLEEAEMWFEKHLKEKIKSE